MNLNSWQELLKLRASNSSSLEFSEPLVTDYEQDKSESKGESEFITIGCCGFPNVGKSSLLNTIMGRKVVSVSRTPGHTKHLQTLFLNQSVRFCDCPGLVFPSLVTKPLQVCKRFSFFNKF